MAVSPLDLLFSPITDRLSVLWFTGNHVDFRIGSETGQIVGNWASTLVIGLITGHLPVRYDNGSAGFVAARLLEETSSDL